MRGTELPSLLFTCPARLDLSRSRDQVPPSSDGLTSHGGGYVDGMTPEFGRRLTTDYASRVWVPRHHVMSSSECRLIENQTQTALQKATHLASYDVEFLRRSSRLASKRHVVRWSPRQCPPSFQLQASHARAGCVAILLGSLYHRPTNLSIDS